jgi:hypothetical protein
MRGSRRDTRHTTFWIARKAAVHTERAGAGRTAKEKGQAVVTKALQTAFAPSTAASRTTATPADSRETPALRTRPGTRRRR